MAVEEKKTAPKQEDLTVRAMRLAKLLRVRINEELAQQKSAQPLQFWLRAEPQKGA
ncbi:MAG: hypothetical protein ABR907_00555 [Terracidiphilus sp.]|jgi:hypothetical protein